MKSNIIVTIPRALPTKLPTLPRALDTADFSTLSPPFLIPFLNTDTTFFLNPEIKLSADLPTASAQSANFLATLLLLNNFSTTPSTHSTILAILLDTAPDASAIFVAAFEDLTFVANLCPALLIPPLILLAIVAILLPFLTPFSVIVSVVLIRCSIALPCL